MYKVFFNASSIILCSESENSFKDNNHQIAEFKEDTFVSSLLLDLEESEVSKNLVFTDADETKLWKRFRKQFIRIEAAGGIVSDKNGRILTMKRLGVWDLPKGKIEKKESAEDAAVREVEEECGISGLEIKNKIGSMFHLYRSPFHPEPNNFVLKETFWFEMFYNRNETPAPQTSENIEEVRWMTKDELPVFFSNTYPNLVELMENYLKKSSAKR